MISVFGHFLDTNYNADIGMSYLEHEEPART